MLEKVLRILTNRFKRIGLKIYTKESNTKYITILVYNLDNAVISSIFFNFNEERFSYSYMDFRTMGKRTEKYVSKKELLEYIADLILDSKLKYKKINQF